MASPFALFRKNQKTLLVVLVVLSLFAFTLTSLFESDGLNLPFLGLILGTCIMTAVGAKVKKTALFAAAGAVGGLLAGFLASQIINPTASNAVANTSLGALSRPEYEQILGDRRIANQFIGLAIQEALGPDGRNRAPQFGFGLNGATIDEEVILNVILRKEAEKLGIIVDNDAVSQYINRATDDKLSKTAYKNVLNSMKISDGQLYRILSDQIAIKAAQSQLGPQSVMTPEKYWDLYGKMQFNQTIQSVSVPVDGFLDSVSEPDDDELRQFFEAHKLEFPGVREPGAIGFRQPRKVQVAYIEASYLEIEGTISEITDEEIENFYEENKEVLYLNRQVPDLDFGFGADLQDPAGTGTVAPDLFDPNLPTPRIDLDNLDKETTQEPPEESPKTTDKVEKPESTETPDPKKPAEETEKTDSDDSQPDPSETPDEQSSLSRLTNRLQTVSYQETPAEEQETDKTTPAEKPSAENAESKENSEESKPETEAKDETETEKPTPPNPEEKTTTVPPAPDSEEKTTTVPPAPDFDNDQPLDADKPGEVPPKYDPLDDLLRSKIRDDLLESRTKEKQQKLAAEVLDIMTTMSDEYFVLAQKFEDNPKKLAAARDQFVKEADDKLEALAKEKGLNYDITPLWGGEELSLSNEYSVGSATRGMELSNENRETVVSYLFQTSHDDVYEANAARSLDPDSIYLYWKTTDKAAHVPSLDDPGLREQVVEAWKLLKAEPLAKKRAEELAEKLKGAEETWSELLLVETITGEEEGVLMNPPLIERFSRMRTASVPSMFGPSMPKEVPEMTTLSTVDVAGPKFLEASFTQIEAGGVGVIPNDDHSVYYVVQVQERLPSTPGQLTAQREIFLRTDMFRSQPGFANGTIQFASPYIYMVGNEGQGLYRSWIENLFKKYDVKIVERDESESGPL